MKYALLIYENEAIYETATPEQMAAVFAEHERIGAALAEKNAFIAGSELQPTIAARTTRRQGGEALITDGPFAETTEHLGGMYIIEAADLDEAIGYAKMLSGTVEIRPLS